MKELQKVCATSTDDLPKTHKQEMLEALNDADFWHGQQAQSFGLTKKDKLMHRKYQIAIWWAIQNLGGLVQKLEQGEVHDMQLK